MAHDDGGPAMPIQSYVNEYGVVVPPHLGMTLRDWFAGEAGAKLCTEVDMDDNWELIARRAYAFADAMLAQRSK